MSNRTQTFWCALEPCHSLRYRGLSHSPSSEGLEKFNSAGEFRSHLAEEHAFEIERCLDLKKATQWHGDGATHYYNVCAITDGDRVVAYVDEACERDPEDAALWGIGDG